MPLKKTHKEASGHCSHNAGLILAAGASERMGRPKPLLEIGDKTLLEDQVKRLRKAGLYPIIVVVGASAGSVMGLHKHLDVIWKLNKDWKAGAFSSLQIGLGAVPEECGGCLILPIDVPFLPARVFSRIIKASLSCRDVSVVVPAFDNKGGHPIWVSKKFADRLRTLPASSRLNRIIRCEPASLRVAVNAPAILRNVNTQDDWQALKTDEKFNKFFQ